MKKSILVTICLGVSIVCTSCNQLLDNPYAKKDGSFYFLNGKMNYKERFAYELAVLPKLSYLDHGYDDNVTSELLINNTTNTPIVAISAHGKIYPASLTKLMTAYLTSKYAKMDDIVTLNRNLTYEAGAQLLHLKQGDKISVRELYRGLLVYSANDCATMLGEHISGSEEKFVKLMNKELKMIGATNTHFQNAHGLHNPEHYTTAYDLYLMVKANLKYKEFKETISLPSATIQYKNAQNLPVSVTVQSTNLYLNGNYKVPKDTIMFGGKTGTTTEAGSCLMVITQNKKNEEFISIVTGAIDKPNLYKTMTKLLKLSNESS